MFKKLIMLFKIGRKLSTSGAISSIYEIYNPPIGVKIFFFIIGFNFGEKKITEDYLLVKNYVMLCKKWERHLLKLGQFLATRPDIIGENVSKDLEKLQDKLPPFNTSEQKIY